MGDGSGISNVANVSTVCVGVLAMLVWGHHLYSAGIDADSRIFYRAASVCVACPSVCKIIG